MTRTVGVVGAGYVGLTTAVCLAERGHRTVCVDNNSARVTQLRGGVTVLDEPQLAELLADGIASGQLWFTTDYTELAACDLAFVCVPTPAGTDGSADLAAVWSCVGELERILPPDTIVIMKSTVPVGTTRSVDERLSHSGSRAVSNPEFLREGHAVADSRHPNRVLIGTEDDEAAERVAELYGHTDTLLRMGPESAELAKYASNAFLAVKISYTNSLAQLCTRLGADVCEVTSAMGSDERIGRHFLQPGPGWGGSCLPKDTAALLHMGQRHGVELPEVVASRVTNAAQVSRIVTALSDHMLSPLSAARIAVLGLTFKAGTCDIRDSPALNIASALSRRGAEIRGYDPRLDMIDPAEIRRCAITAVDDPYLAVKDADAIVLLTEWPQFRGLDWRRISDLAPGGIVLDSRNALDSSDITGAGLCYLGNGTASGF